MARGESLYTTVAHKCVNTPATGGNFNQLRGRPIGAEATGGHVSMSLMHLKLAQSIGQHYIQPVEAFTQISAFK